MEDSIVNVGVASAVALLILKEVFAFIIKQKNGKNGKDNEGIVAITVARERIKDLWEWHAPEEGRQAWKDNSKIEGLLNTLNSNIKELSREIRSFRNSRHSSPEGR